MDFREPESIEILIPDRANAFGRRVLDLVTAASPAAGMKPVMTNSYKGDAKWLVMWGVGGGNRSAIRDLHGSRGGITVLLEFGFFKRDKTDGYVRLALNDDYCTRWLDQTPPAPERWNELQVELREDADPTGPIILAGIGPKQRAYMNGVMWEEAKLTELQRRFPGREIVYRPKPNRPFPRLPVRTIASGPIEQALKGASLVACLHSNVAIDAVVAGVPFEAEEGPSTWLRDKPYTRENRLDLLQRIARWQYRLHEIGEGLKFARSMACA